MENTFPCIARVPESARSLTHLLAIASFMASLFFIGNAHVADAATNLIYNPGFETASPSASNTPDGWIRGRWGTNTANFMYPVPSGDGSKAARVTLSAYSSGDAKWASAPVAVTPGRTYTYADSYAATVPSYLTIEYTLSGGAFAYPNIAVLPASPGMWQTRSVSFTVPANVTSARVFHLIKQNGTLEIDNASLTDTTPPATSNLIQNPSFEVSGAGGLPEDWTTGRWGTNTTTFTYTVPGRTGADGAEVQMTSYTTGDAKWVFNNVTVAAGGSYRFTDYSKSVSTTYVTAQFRKSDGSYVYLDLGAVPPSSGWQQFTKAFTVPAGVVSMTVFHVIKGVGTLTVDDYSLVPLASDPNKFDKGYVSLNFDDGWLSVYQNAIPILDAAGFKSDQFIVTNYVAGNFPAYVSLAQVKDMQAKGHVIGAHTKTHPDLTMLSTAAATEEVGGSRQYLTSNGLSPVSSFAYPLGAYNASVQQIVKDAGFLAGRSSDGGYNDKTTDRYALRRQPMVAATTIAEAKAYIDTAIANKTWVILLFHEVNTSGNQYAVTPAFLQQVVDYLKSKQMTPITVGQGVALMNQ